MSKKEFRYSEEADEIEELQDRICQKVRSIGCLEVLRRLDDIVKRVYRRGSR